jgi:exopolysaccharide biosynthesis polyprenyl glycosylphosphotransferase
LSLSLATKPAPPADQSTQPAGQRPVSVPVDIRAAKPYPFASRSFRHLALRLASVAALLVLDLTALGLGLYVALVLRELYYGRAFGDILWSFLWTDTEASYLPFSALVLVLVFWQAGLYSSRERRTGFGRILSSLVIIALLVLAFGLGTGHSFSTFGLIPTTLLLTALCVGLFRASYDVVTRDLLRLFGVRRRAILAGEGEHLLHLYRTLGSDRSGIEYRFVGAVSRSDVPKGLAALGNVAELRSILAEHAVDELIVTDSDFGERELLEMVEQAHRAGVKVLIAPKTTELLTQRAEYVPGQGAPLFELRAPVFVGTDWVLKRTFDVVVSLGVVVLGLPLWIAIAAAIKLTSPGPVFYRDPRVGLNEREFGLVKFRTMRVGAAELQAELEPRNEATGALFKIREDPRVTRVGRILRRLSIDEIPNIWNVFRGELSLVGPRPLPIRDFRKLEPWHRKRYLVLPGMTGLWQISDRADLSFDDLVRLDFYYLDNWSIWLDISILVKTPPAVFARRGAY